MNELEFLQSVLRVLNTTTQLGSKELKSVKADEWQWALFTDKQVDVVCAMLQDRIDEIQQGGESNEHTLPESS